jgi:hypothetical protein
MRFSGEFEFSSYKMPIRFKSNNELIGDKGFLIQGEQMPCKSGSSPSLQSTRPFGHSLLSSSSNPIPGSPQLPSSSSDASFSYPYASAQEPASSNSQPTYFMNRMGSAYRPATSSTSGNRRNLTFAQAPYLLPFDATQATSGAAQSLSFHRDSPRTSSDHSDRYLRDLPNRHTSIGALDHSRDVFSCNQVISDPLFEITSPHYPYR